MSRYKAMETDFLLHSPAFVLQTGIGFHGSHSLRGTIRLRDNTLFIHGRAAIPLAIAGREIKDVNSFEKDCDYSCIVIHHAGNSYSESSIPDDVWESKYNGIPYHYIIDYKGIIYEGRHIKYKGEHVQKGNTRRIGICFLGDYASENDFLNISNIASSIGDYFISGRDMVPNEFNINAVKLLIKALMKCFDIHELGGHREVATLINKKLTRCPGDNLMPLVIELRAEFNLSAPVKKDLRDFITDCK